MCDTQATLSYTVFKLAGSAQSPMRTEYVQRVSPKVVFLAMMKNCLDFVECYCKSFTEEFRFYPQVNL